MRCADRARARSRSTAACIDDPDAEVDTEGLVFTVDGTAGRTTNVPCSCCTSPPATNARASPRHHPSVLDLLPVPLRRRGVQPVGRLDADTTGLLLLTDDGALIHRLTSPKHHVRRSTRSTTVHPVTLLQVERLRAGVVLHDDPQPVRAAACEATGDRTLRLTLTEGKYHQVKRMVAAAGNRVELLHRSAFGPWHCRRICRRASGDGSRPPSASSYWRVNRSLG